MSTSAGFDLDLHATIGNLTMDVTLPDLTARVVLVGPNGAGKTSLLLLILGILPVRRGHVRVAGDTLFDGARGIDRPLQERQLAYVPQDYALFPHLSVQENVAFAVRCSTKSSSSRERRLRVEEALESLDLAALRDRSIATLSGGEKQRVALARAISTRPKALLLDEPLAALDVRSRQEVRAFLAEYLERLELPTVVVTHDPADARILGDCLVVLEAGRVTRQGTWDELVRQPRSAFTTEFLAE